MSVLPCERNNCKLGERKEIDPEVEEAFYGKFKEIRAWCPEHVRCDYLDLARSFGLITHDQNVHLHRLAYAVGAPVSR